MVSPRGTVASANALSLTSSFRFLLTGDREEPVTNMATVFLTGASGFLGGHLLRGLRAAGFEGRALSPRAGSGEAIVRRGGVPVGADLAGVASLTAPQACCEAVFLSSAYA